MTQTPVRSPADAARKHRRETFRAIYLPVGAGAVLVVAGLVLALLMPQARQVSAISDFLLTILVLCPLALCLLPLALGLVAAAAGMNAAHRRTAGVLERLVGLSHGLYLRVDRQSERIARRALELGAKIAPAEKLLFGAFDRPQSSRGKEVTHDQPTSKRQ